MKFIHLFILLALMISTPAMAEKPSPAGQGKPEAAANKSKQGMEEDTAEMKSEVNKKAEKKEQEAKEKTEEVQEEAREKHKEMKTEKERKEEGKGSEKGQAAREEHSKKWWKFWE